jgi:hypothetical protein
MTDLGRLAREFLAAFESADRAGLRELCAPHVGHEATGTGGRFEGVDALVAIAQAWRKALPDVVGDVCRSSGNSLPGLSRPGWRSRASRRGAR